MCKVSNVRLILDGASDSWFLRLPISDKLDRCGLIFDQSVTLHAAKLEDGLALFLNGLGWLIEAWRVADLVCLENLSRNETLVYVMYGDVILGRTAIVPLEAKYLDEIEHLWTRDKVRGVKIVITSELDTIAQAPIEAEMQPQLSRPDRLESRNKLRR